MGRKYWSSTIHAMGLLAVCFLILSLIFQDEVQIRHFHLAVCVAIPTHSFSFVTFELKLFSRYLWIRRAIVICFAILDMFVANFIFGYLRFELDKFLIIFGAAVLLYVILVVFLFYISDKIEKKNLEAINQKLADELKKNEK